MESTHKVQKYALIHSAAGEILAHLDALTDCSEKEIELHVLHIEKAAIFIQFLEDIYIIHGTESIEDDEIKFMWELVQKPSHQFHPVSEVSMWKPIASKMEEYQKKINGKFLTISPF